MKRIVGLLLTFVMLFYFFTPTILVSAEEITDSTELKENLEEQTNEQNTEEKTEDLEEKPEDKEEPEEPVIKTYTVYLEDENGSNMINSFDTYKEAYTYTLEKEKEDVNDNLVIYKDSKIRYVTYGLVNFRTKASSGINTSYVIEFNARNGYTNGYYGADAAFLGTNEDGSKIKFKQAGVIGWVNYSEIELVNMNKNYNNVYTSCYIMTKNDIWELRHNIVTNIYVYKNGSSKVILGNERPSGMKDNTYYLSYDGHYFYKESLEGYKLMIQDYKNRVSTNAINAGKPFYNYYQFISHRSISNYISENIRQDLSLYTAKPKSYPSATNESQLFGEETSFIQYQNEFGTNAILMLGVAKNESGNGKSNIAINTNNLFGHGAFDSAPGASANRYSSVAQSIYIHAKKFISEGYLDSNDYMKRYYGGNVGDKSSGMNVSYASDPYWGEKAAQYYYYFDKQYGFQDYRKYGIGIKTSITSYPVKANPTSSSATLYKTGQSTSYAVTILSKVTGEVIDGSNVWYKIQTDSTLNSNRTGIVQDRGEYDFDHNVGYVHSSWLSYVQMGKDEKVRYTVKFNPNGGKFSDNITSTKSLTIEEYVIPAINPPSKEGYRFIGWDKEVEAATEDVTYTAVYEELVKNYTITFDANGGIFKDNSKTKNIEVKSGEKPSVENPIKEGYKFLGWDKEVEKANKNTTYTATWEKIEYFEITFDALEGSFSDKAKTKKITVEKNNMPTILEKPTREGYIFTGWNPIIVNATKNTTYTAVYEKEEEILLKETTGEFYFHEISSNNSGLYIKGYSTIDGVQSDITAPIDYEIHFFNIDTEKNTVIKLNRILNKELMPFELSTINGFKATYSWFDGIIPLDKLEQGNYQAYIVAKSSSLYTKKLVRNLYGKTMISNYESEGKQIWIRNNYYLKTVPMEFFVRNEKISDKNNNPIDNMITGYHTISFDENFLNIRGFAHNVGGDYGKKSVISRTLILENTKSFNTKKISISTIQNGNYEITLRVPDGFDKTKAWFDAKVDVSDLEPGVYAIYIANSANIDDFAELNDIFGKTISSTITIKNKKYSLKVNPNLRYRIELYVE